MSRRRKWKREPTHTSETSSTRPSIRRSIHLWSTHPFVNAFVLPSVRLPPVYISVCPSIHTSFLSAICPSSLHIIRSIRSPVQSIHPFYPSIHPPVYPPIHAIGPPIRWSVCPSIHASTYPTISPCVHPSTHPSILSAMFIHHIHVESTRSSVQSVLPFIQP